MGRQSESVINHFSHPHPLHLTNPQSSQTCSACKQITHQNQPIYTCKSPSCIHHNYYSLHLKCSQLPPRITHPCHHNHPLSVVIPTSPAANPSFTCAACGTQGDGFSYSCKECDVNIHVMCAQLPLVLSHRSHCHQLKLVFTPPYGSNAFSCDVCGVIGGSNCWLYRCCLCGFDAHLSCATTTSNAQSVAGDGGRSTTGPDQSTLFLNSFNNQRDQYLQAMMGYGGNGNNQIMQALMGGGGGGGSNPLLQTILGGGGGGGGGGMNSQILQTILGGGGGGGGGSGGMNSQFLQTILGGGVDLSSVVGNVGDLGGLMGAGFGVFGF